MSGMSHVDTALKEIAVAITNLTRQDKLRNKRAATALKDAMHALGWTMNGKPGLLGTLSEFRPQEFTNGETTC